MNNKKEISAAIIIIGNEVLSGRTKDLNTSTLATWLNSLGISVGEVRVIPDIENSFLIGYEKDKLVKLISFSNPIDVLEFVG